MMPTTIYSMVVFDQQDWNHHLSWRVPVDDDHQNNFTVDLIEKSGAELERYHAEIVRKVLNGDLHIDDVPREHPQLIIIQDDVVLAAQRPRKIWLRELRALAAGTPLKNWVWPLDLTVASGA